MSTGAATETFVVLALLGVSSTARADRSKLEYRAPAGCASEADFIDAVRTRGGQFDEAATVTTQVDIEAVADGFGGTLRVWAIVPAASICIM